MSPSEALGGHSPHSLYGFALSPVGSLTLELMYHFLLALLMAQSHTVFQIPSTP